MGVFPPVPTDLLTTLPIGFGGYGTGKENGEIPIVFRGNGSPQDQF